MKPTVRGLALMLGYLCSGVALQVRAEEFDVLERQLELRAQWDNPRLEREVCRRDALLFESDLTPVHVIWRRTWALLEHLEAAHPSLDFSRERQALEARRPAVAALRLSTSEPTSHPRALFETIAATRRAIAFKNPVLSFDAILFLKHNKQVRGYRHMVDQYLGFNAERAGGVYVLEAPFGPAPRVRSVLADAPVLNGRLAGQTIVDRGGFTGLDLDYDGQSLLFAFTEAEHHVPADASYTGQYWSRDEIPRDRGAAHH